MTNHMILGEMSNKRKPHCSAVQNVNKIYITYPLTYPIGMGALSPLRL